MNKIHLMSVIVFILALTAPGADAWSFSFGSSDDPTYEEGRDLALKGEYKDAVGMLENVLKEDEKNSDAWNMLGFSYRNLGQMDLAWDAYEKALTIDPNHKGAHEYLGEWYLMQGDLSSAKAQLAKLGALCPSGCQELETLAAKVSQINN